jgi:hypothetical protein
LLKGILEDFEKTDNRIVVASLREASNFCALAYVFTEYLRDPSVTALGRKECRIFGSVVGYLSDPGKSINLFQGTGLEGLAGEGVEYLKTALQLGTLPETLFGNMVE